MSSKGEELAKEIGAFYYQIQDTFPESEEMLKDMITHSSKVDMSLKRRRSKFKRFLRSLSAKKIRIVNK